VAAVTGDNRGAPAQVLTAAGRDLRAPRAAGVAGLLFAALFIGAILLVRGQPAADSSPAEVAEWYLRGDSKRVAFVGLYLAPFAGIAFLWFIAVIRSHVGDREDRFFATVFLGSGLLFVAMLFAAAAAASAPLTFLYVYGVRAAAVFMISVSMLALRTGSLPRWLVIVGFVVAVIMLFSVSFFKFVVLLFPLWVAAVSIVILLTARPPEAEQAQPTGSA